MPLESVTQTAEARVLFCGGAVDRVGEYVGQNPGSTGVIDFGEGAASRDRKIR